MSTLFFNPVEAIDGVRFIARCEIDGDLDGESWTREMLWSAKSEQHSIDDYEVVGAYQGLRTGLQLVIFTFDLEWGHGVDQDTPTSDLLVFGQKVACSIVNNDADVIFAASTMEA